MEHESGGANLHMVECLIFDMDDTLCPEREFVLARLAAVARRLEERYGPQIDFERELVTCYEADLRTNVFDTVLERAGVAPEEGVIRELVALYRSLPVDLAPYPDVEPALELWSRRLPLALITDGHGPTQRAKLACVGLAPYFREVVFTHDLGPGGIKPSAAAFRLVQQRIGFEGPAAMVGDNPALDFPAPKQLGWTTVRIVRPGAKFARAEADPSCTPDHVIGHLDELQAIDGLRECLAG